MQIPGFRGILGQFCQALVGRWTRPALKPVSDLSLPSTHLPAGQASHIFTCSCHEKCLQWQTGAPWVSTLVPKLWREVASGNLRWICLRSWPKLWNQMRALFVIFGVSWCRFAIQLCTGCTVFFFQILLPNTFWRFWRVDNFLYVHWHRTHQLSKYCTILHQLFKYHRFLSSDRNGSSTLRLSYGIALSSLERGPFPANTVDI